MKDALGNEILVGKWYAYSNNQRGFTRTVVGITKSINPEKVAIKVMGAWESLYGGEMEPVEHGKTVSVYGAKLFPISKYSIGYEMNTGDKNSSKIFKK